MDVFINTNCNMLSNTVKALSPFQDSKDASGHEYPPSVQSSSTGYSCKYIYRAQPLSRYLLGKALSSHHFINYNGLGSLYSSQI